MLLRSSTWAEPVRGGVSISARAVTAGATEAVPQQVVVLFEVLLEKDPGRRFQNPAELLKALPTITGAIDAASRLAIWQGRSFSVAG